MRELLVQLERSLSSENYFVSLFVALSIPDIGGAMDSTSGNGNKLKYVEWYEKWVRPLGGSIAREEFMKAVPAEERHFFEHSYPEDLQVENPLSGWACWDFRCSLLHQGRMTLKNEKYKRILFVEPGSALVIHGGVMDDALAIDVTIFCKEIIAGAKNWLASVEGTDRYEKNLAQFVQRYPNGISPYVVGIPVVG